MRSIVAFSMRSLSATAMFRWFIEASVECLGQRERCSVGSSKRSLSAHATCSDVPLLFHINSQIQCFTGESRESTPIPPEATCSVADLHTMSGVTAAMFRCIFSKCSLNAFAMLSMIAAMFRCLSFARLVPAPCPVPWQRCSVAFYCMLNFDLFCTRVHALARSALAILLF